jgi:hypothetical protein
MKNTIKSQDFTELWRKDKIHKYISKWPILNLDVLDKKGIWNTIQDKLQVLTDEKKIQNLNVYHVNKFFLNRPEIDFEINYFSNILNKCYIFKYENKIYCYSYGTVVRKNGRKINARFYFDVNKVLSLNLPI